MSEIMREMKGRFAPSPSGRMHVGNIFTALLSWLSVRSVGGKWVLRIEDLDPQRSKYEYARLIEDDLNFLGLDWDEGGLDDRGPSGPYSQSRRHDLYEGALKRLLDTGMCYGCTCTRAELNATQAPHRSDGRVVYGGRCRPAVLPVPFSAPGKPHAVRLGVIDDDILFQDLVFGEQRFNLAYECGDFILRRADGAWSYQLAVVVDDAMMGITEVVRGADLLASAAQQIYLYGLLGFDAPRFGHVPLICNTEGRRLSKRDRDLSMESLRKRFSAAEIIGRIAYVAGLIQAPEPCMPTDLATSFSLQRLKTVESIRLDETLFQE